MDKIDMDLVRKLKKYRAPLPTVKLDQALKVLKSTNKIDGISGAVNVGLIIDSYNNEVVRKKELEFISESNARNKYYAPLWKMAIEEQMNSSRYKDIFTPDILGTDVKKRRKMGIDNEFIV